MPSFGKGSLVKLNELDPKLQEVLNEAIKVIDFTIICGHRNQIDQDKAVAEGKSKTKWPNSKHNSIPSKAADIMPYLPVKGIDWNDKASLCYLIGIVKGIAVAKGIKLRCGVDFNRNGIITDDSFFDGPHVELEE